MARRDRTTSRSSATVRSARRSRSCSAQRGWRVARLREAAERLSAAARRALRPRGRAHPAGRRRDRRRCSPRTEAADIYEWRNAAGDVLLRIGSDAERSLSGWPEAQHVLRSPSSSGSSTRGRARCPACEVRARLRGGRRRATPATTCDARRAARPRRRATRVARASSSAATARNSFVRGAARRRPVTDLGFFFDWLIVDVLPHEPAVWDPINGQICDPARPTTVVSGGPGRRRWEFMRLPGETHRRAEQRGDGVAPARAVGRPAGQRGARAPRRLPFQARWVDAWRAAASCSPATPRTRCRPSPARACAPACATPRTSPGSSTSCSPARAAEPLLDTYASERIPHVRALIDFSMALGKVICVADPAEAAARDAACSRSNASARKLWQQSCQLGSVPAASRRAPRRDSCSCRAACAATARRASSTTWSAAAWRCVSPHGDPARVLGPELGWLLRLARRHHRARRPDGAVTDLDGSYARWFGEQGVAVVLQRPDFDVFGTAGTLEGAAELVATLRAKLAMTAAE